jgi:hypothetical protein
MDSENGYGGRDSADRERPPGGGGPAEPAPAPGPAAEETAGERAAGAAAAGAESRPGAAGTAGRARTAGPEGADDPSGAGSAGELPGADGTGAGRAAEEGTATAAADSADAVNEGGGADATGDAGGAPDADGTAGVGGVPRAGGAGGPAGERDRGGGGDGDGPGAEGADTEGAGAEGAGAAPVSPGAALPIRAERGPEGRAEPDPGDGPGASAGVVGSDGPGGPDGARAAPHPAGARPGGGLPVLAEDRRWLHDLWAAVFCSVALLVLLHAVDLAAGALDGPRAAVWSGLSLTLFLLLYPPRVTAGHHWLSVRGLVRERRISTDLLTHVTRERGLAQRIVLRDLEGHRVEVDPSTLIGNPLIWHELDTGARRARESGVLRMDTGVLGWLADRVERDAAWAVFDASDLT